MDRLVFGMSGIFLYYFKSYFKLTLFLFTGSKFRLKNPITNQLKILKLIGLLLNKKSSDIINSKKMSKRNNNIKKSMKNVLYIKFYFFLYFVKIKLTK